MDVATSDVESNEVLSFLLPRASLLQQVALCCIPWLLFADPEPAFVEAWCLNQIGILQKVSSELWML